MLIDLNDPDGWIAFCNQLVEDAGELPERAEDFAASVIEKAESISEWIEMESRVTEKQATALENMRTDVDRWTSR